MKFMSKKRIFILQDTPDACEEVKSKFGGDQEFAVIGSSVDGISAIAEIAETRPDVLITELVISGYDGLSVIERVKAIDENIKIVVLSALCREEIVSRAVAVGADYFMAKPVNFDLLKDRIKELSAGAEVKPAETQNLHKVSLEEKVSKIFINVGIPPHIKGYSFLREGVIMAVKDPNVINNITKQLYPRIGEKYKTTPSKVERAIRHAIEVAWNRGRIENINNILGVRAYVGADKPTNGEFIALVADKMLLEKA